MRALKPLATALAAAGIIAVPDFAAATGTPLNDICGGAPLVVDIPNNLAYYTCDTDPNPVVVDQNVTLTGPCTIKVPANVDFTLDTCRIDAAGYPMTIKGSGTSQIKLFNSSITNAAKLDVSTGNGHGNACGDALFVNWRIEADIVNLKANGGIEVSTWQSGTSSFAGGILADSVAVKAKYGDICVKLGKNSAGGDGIQADKTDIKTDLGSIAITDVP